jgi:hypothetical protein
MPTPLNRVLTLDAIDLLASRLRTPLQIQLHLTMSLEAGYQTGEIPVSAELVESVLSRQLDDLEPTLTRHGYHLKDLVEQFDVKPAEIKALFNNQLDPTRVTELRRQFLAAGLPYLTHHRHYFHFAVNAVLTRLPFVGHGAIIGCQRHGLL